MTQVNDDHEGAHGRPAVVDKFRTQAWQSMGVGVIFGAIGALMIVVSVGDIPGPLATYIGGCAFGLASVIMIIGWGAAWGHAELAEHATSDHRQMYARIDGRVGDVEEFEREQCDLLGGLVDQVGAARRRREN
jgi:hypothetical protein